ncbi:MAG: 30S ribosomal protein S6 [Candidatus Shikimatogenerans bostrichidophilus]|nr:MAG: 30S ribosomal protein S6 [Candidatus Shikimatogenerans bostrichidophilus]
MNRYYETIIILTPVLSEEEIKNFYLEYKNYLTDNNVKIIKKEKWGMKKLSYEIKKKLNGFFYLFFYKSNPIIIKPLNNKLLQDERILRFLTVKINKYGVKYLLKNKNNKKYEKK